MNQLDLKPFKKVMLCDNPYGEPFFSICQTFCIPFSYGKAYCYLEYEQKDDSSVVFILKDNLHIKQKVDRKLKNV